MLSAALPYSLDLLALRRLPTSVFGVLTSLNPAAAAVAGAVILHDQLKPATLGGMAAVMLASAGAVMSRRECPGSGHRQRLIAG
jgi:inner membrane transporter RhtA